ncbi:MAG: SLOG family protein [Cyanobacteriota bacterium]|nr:SLOG family protein [Cyanobacteriota bacterium]
MLITHPCRVAVVGSRTYWNLKAVRDFIAQLPAGCTVISGGARGVDQTAEQAARAKGIPVQIYPADWHQHGKFAGIRRNHDIIQSADVVVAFWDGSSPGTAHSIQLAKSMNKPIQIIY